jgi:hypothetical protein
MENKIPTARQILNKYKNRELGLFNKDIEEAMIEFAKPHVEAALKAAVDAGEVYHTDEGYIVRTEEKQILRSYPLKNIK